MDRLSKCSSFSEGILEYSVDKTISRDSRQVSLSVIAEDHIEGNRVTSNSNIFLC